MVAIQKQDGKYCIYHEGQHMGTIELYDNPHHMSNCYVKLDMKHLDTSISAELFGKLKEITVRPLQAMIDSDDVKTAEFLIAGGFICKRRCYEVDAVADDYIGGSGGMRLCCCSTGAPDYEQCCGVMYCYYVNTHKAINPWTADYATFCAELPGTAVYAKMDDCIASLAFVACNEIAYVCGTDEDRFSQFAQSLASSMLAEHENIFFESDNCDWAAMMLKSLFINQDETSFDTYILGDSI